MLSQADVAELIDDLDAGLDDVLADAEAGFLAAGFAPKYLPQFLEPLIDQLGRYRAFAIARLERRMLHHDDADATVWH